MRSHNQPLFENCTKCTICTEYCPVSAATSKFPGPKQAGPDGERQRLKDPSSFDESLKLCTNCKRCEVACPSGVPIGDIIQRARRRHSARSLSLRNALLSHTDFMGGITATPLATIANIATKIPPVKKALEFSLGIPAQRDLPEYATSTFRQWFKKNAAREQRLYTEKVAFFHGCYANYNNPELGKSIVKVLNALGVGVELLQDERCCGVPLIANGFFDDARKNARINSKSIHEAAKKKMPTLVASSTCAMTLRDEYPHILDIDNTAWRHNVVFLTRFIHSLIEKKGEPSLQPLHLKIAYHTSCHMERLGWSGYAIALLRMLPGVATQILSSNCCGIAGTYGFKKENYATSQKIGARLFEEIDKSDADIVVTECETCKMQIEMSTSKRCEHPVTLLAEALRCA